MPRPRRGLPPAASAGASPKSSPQNTEARRGHENHADVEAEPGRAAVVRVRARPGCERPTSAMSKPSAPPKAARVTLSVSSWRTSLARVARWSRGAGRGRRHTADGSAEDRGASPEVTGEGRVKVRPAAAVRASGLASLPAEEARAPGAPEVTFEKCPEGVTLCCVLLGSGHRARPVSR